MKITLAILLCTIGQTVMSQDANLKDNKIDSIYLDQFAAKYRIAPALVDKLFRFYAGNNFELAWFVSNTPVPHASLLINVIDNRTEHGVATSPIMDGYNLSDTLAYLVESNLKSSNYFLKKLKSCDVMLTASYFQHIPAMWSGAIDPYSKQDIEWYFKKNTFSYTHALDSILSDSSSKNPFMDYRNFHTGYFRLKDQLKKYHSIKKNGGWPAISTGGLARGDTGKLVMTLAARLKMTGDLMANLKEPRFNNKLQKAVKRYQRRHGLRQDGIVGEETLRELNISVDDRIRQIIVNLERWRWVPPLTKEEYIYINIPEYQLYVFNGDKLELQMPIIVGNRASHTVIFSDVLEYVVLNPYWNIPYSIAVEEMLPKRKKDSTYFKDRNIEVGVKGNYDSLEEESIDWKNLSPDDFRYTLRQQPGPLNQMGSIKFIFPNKFAIYLHDTPAPKLFEARDRYFSHGCIRVAKPIVLADFILENKEDFSAKKIKRLISEGKEKDVWIKLDNPVPVYILYFTAWASEDGNIHYRKDIYGHDEKIIEHLFENL